MIYIKLVIFGDNIPDAEVIWVAGLNSVWSEREVRQAGYILILLPGV